MASRPVLVIAATAAACSHHAPAMYPAGTPRDDGYGNLAQKSASLVTSPDDAPAFTARHHHRRDGDPYGGDPYAGAYTDDGDGELPDIPPRPRTALWSQVHTRSTPREAPIAGLTGAIEGTVTWHGAPPPPLTTACGAIEQPSVRITNNGAVAGALVYIEHVDIGRAIPNYSRPATVGGLVAKRGCALAPAVQILTPLPSGFAIHGDTREVTLRVTQPAPLTTVAPSAPVSPLLATPLGPAGPPVAQAFALQAAGRVVLPAQPGVTRIEADDGSLAAAWVVALDTPYYALTDDAGRFRIDELAAGTYELSILRPSVPTSSGGRLSYGPPVIVRRSIKIDATHAAHLDVAIGP
jgi:hypothetical protein